MENKYTTFGQFLNREITPKLVEDALEHLPFNYIKQVQQVFEDAVKEKLLERSYSKQYIIEVRQGDSFNVDIMKVLTFVGLKNKELEASFGKRKTKKVPSSKN